MNLTKEQQAQIEVYKDKYRAIGLSTEPTDRARCEKAFAACDAFYKRKTREVIWADSPYAGIKIAAQLATGKANPTDAEIAAQAEMASYGSFNAYWVAYHSYIAYVLGKKKTDLIDIVNDIIRDAGVYWTFEDTIVCTDKPVKIVRKGIKLHNTEGKALEYKDGTGFYAIDGVRCSSLLESALEARFASNK